MFKTTAATLMGILHWSLKRQALYQGVHPIAHDLIAAFARLGVAAVFLMSGQTKVDGWRVSENAIDLFTYEYNLPLFSPVLAAHLAVFAEHLLPLMLIVGIFTRLGALGLVAMVVVIQIFVYPSAWPTHASWLAALLYLVSFGPGRLSLDAFISK